MLPRDRVGKTRFCRKCFQKLSKFLKNTKRILKNGKINILTDLRWCQRQTVGWCAASNTWCYPQHCDLSPTHRTNSTRFLSTKHESFKCNVFHIASCETSHCRWVSRHSITSSNHFNVKPSKRCLFQASQRAKNSHNNDNWKIVDSATHKSGMLLKYIVYLYKQHWQF